LSGRNIICGSILALSGRNIICGSILALSPYRLLFDTYYLLL
jgi:hypothetical protein